MTSPTPPTFLPLTGLYEPSAIRQLPDGRFLVVEDEKGHSFSLVKITDSGEVSSQTLGPGWFHGGEPIWKLDDLEGLALDGAGYLYAVTSHSRDDDGDEQKGRERLVRFWIEYGRVAQPVVAGGLKQALVAAYPVLAAAVQVLDVKSGAGLNIEALEITPDGQQLLIGFRSPLQGNHALIARVNNPAAMFDKGAGPQLAAALEELNLGGQGLRGMAYIASLGGYLLLGGPTSRADDPFGLWFWTGQAGAQPRRVTVAGLPGFARAEGVCAAVIDGVPRIVIVSDDGSRRSGRFAQFVLIDVALLEMAQ